MKNKGFTLIELLVVIAIIGLLSSLAVVSLNSARNKANDAQVKSDLSQFRTYVGVEYPDGMYDGTGENATVLAVANVSPAIAPPACTNETAYDLVVADGTGAGVYGAAGEGKYWAASSPLCADSTHYFCVDSSGQAVVTAAQPTAAAPVCVPAT